MADSSRAGFIALLGAPNAGKSTLVNHLVGQKVSIVTRKAQTTRSRIRAILCREGCQYIFVDTPGIFTPKDGFDRAMVQAALAAAKDSDVLWLLIDAARRDAETQGEAMLTALAEALHSAPKPVAVLLNKIDRTPKPKLLGLAQSLTRKRQTLSLTDGGIFMVSALSGDGCDALCAAARPLLPEGPFLYPQDQLADMPMRLMAAEITREQIFERLHQEIPYGIAVETVRWQRQKNGAVRIEQVIYVSREGFKPIVLGKGGAQIKAISEAARRQIADAAGEIVHLFLFVKHHKNWREQKQFHLMQGIESHE